MPDYKKLYHRLFNSQTDAISILQKAQQDTENMFIESPEPEIVVLKPKPSDGDKPEKE